MEQQGTGSDLEGESEGIRRRRRAGAVNGCPRGGRQSWPRWHLTCGPALREKRLKEVNRAVKK